MSKIEWTEKAWNPIVGCSVVSPGCTNCYAMRQAARIERMGSAPHYVGLTKVVNGNPVWTGALRPASEKVLHQPLRWKASRRVFVNSMSDLFHENAPRRTIDLVFAIMTICQQHTFQVLTKRAPRMRSYLSDPDTPRRIYDLVSSMALDEMRDIALATDADHVRYLKERASSRRIVEMNVWPLPNVWIGVSAEDQKRFDERVLALFGAPAAVRFISAEPLLEPITLSWSTPPGALPFNPLLEDKLDWIIVGGESGPGARHMQPDWARLLLSDCRLYEVAFFMKQMGGPVKARMREIPPDLMVREYPQPRR